MMKREEEKVLKLELTASQQILCDDAVLRRSQTNYLEEAMVEEDIVAWTNGRKSFATVEGKTISLPSCGGSRCLAWGPKDMNQYWLVSLESKTGHVRLYVLKDRKTIVLHRKIERGFDRPFRVRFQQSSSKRRMIFIVADRNGAHLFCVQDESYERVLPSPVKGKLEAVSWIGERHVVLAAGGEVRVVWDVVSSDQDESSSHALLADGPSSSSSKTLSSAARCMNVTKGHDDCTSN